MALADTARLIASLELDPRKFTKGLSAADKALGRSESRAFRAGQQIGTGIRRGFGLALAGIGVLTANVALGVDSLIKLEKATAQTEAVIKSTGGAAGITADKVTELAEKFEGLNATVGDEFIRGAENMLLTFRDIRGKAFEPTLQAVLDMNTAMGNGPEGLTKTAIQVGKALNDPTTGLTALRRVGVTFSKEQVERIKQLQKEGKLYEAQKIILKELNQEFGGSFLAQGGTTAGKVAKFTDSIEDLQRAMAEALLPAIGNIADALTELLADPAVIQGAKDLGKEIGNLFSKQNVTKAAETVGKVMQGIRDAAPVIKDGLGTAARLIGDVVTAFQKLPPDVQKLAIGALAANKLTGGLITNLAGGLISSVLKQLVSGVVNVNGGVVNVNGAGGIPGAGGVPGKGGGGLASKVVKGVGAVTIVGTVAVTAAEIAGVTRDSANRIINSQGNIARSIGTTNTNLSELRQRAANGDTFARQQLAQLERINGKSDAVIRNGFDVSRQIRTAASQEQRAGERIVTTEKQTKAAVDASKARMAAELAATRRENTRGHMIVSSSARNAGERARGGGLAAAAAINRKNFSPKFNVVNNLRLTVRDTQQKLTFQQNAAIYG